jgi:DNA-binding CsgD family transcriptional regulator
VLGISPRTVEFHRTNLLRKLEARNAIELVRIVLGAGEPPQ